MKIIKNAIIGACALTSMLFANIVMAQTPDAESGAKLGTETEVSAEEQAEIDAYIEKANTFLESLTPQYGEISLASAGVTLNLPENLYYLNSKDSQKVLEEAWGNPPDANILGMIFENDAHAYDSEYAVVITFDKSGYVSDEDAQDINFDKLLKTMTKDTKAGNAYRIEKGYEPLTLIGWADTPNYDAVNKRLSWAKSIKFGTAESNTLNYSLRFLGRRGVLEFNYIAEEEALQTIKTAMPEMSQIASYNDGHKYEDFNATTDKVAAYGVAGLIAGGVVAKKLGLIGILLLFLKKGWIIIIAALAFGKRFLGGMFGRKEDDNDTIG